MQYTRKHHSVQREERAKHFNEKDASPSSKGYMPQALNENIISLQVCGTRTRAIPPTRSERLD